MSDDENFVEGKLPEEKWGGTVQCEECGYWGAMDGWTNQDNTSEILYICPECDTFNRVVNPLA